MGAILKGVISPNAIDRAFMTEIGFCGMAWDASSQCVLKIFPVLIQYFEKAKVRLQTKLLHVHSKPNETAQTIAQYVQGTLQINYLVGECTAFLGDKCNTKFGGVTLASTKNVFAKLKDLFSQRQVNRCGLPCTYPK